MCPHSPPTPAVANVDGGVLLTFRVNPSTLDPLMTLMRLIGKMVHVNVLVASSHGQTSGGEWSLIIVHGVIVVLL
jgi:hypothetical protein